MDTPKVSVIVPIYNGEKYLRECLDSIVNQSLRDIEIICVNDGSTDSSGEILCEYASCDGRVKVISQENCGTSMARNRGLLEARGEYLLFVDADDLIDIECAEKVYNVATLEKDLDIIVFGGKTFPSCNTWADDVLSIRDIEYDHDSITALLNEKGSRPYAVNKLYRTGMFREHALLFPKEVLLGEDQALMFIVFPCAQKIKFISDKFYYYRQHENSTMSYFTQYPQNVYKDMSR